MNAMLALQGLLPLIVFAVVDIFASLRTALIAAMIFSVGELVWSYYTFGEIDKLSWVSLGLVFIMGGVAFYMKNDKLFKFQPVVLGVLAAGTLAYFQWRGDPLLVQMMPKVASLFPDERKGTMMSPPMIAMMARMDFMLIFVFIVHGALVAWAAMKKSTMVWLIVRGVGFYALLAAVVLANAALTVAPSP